VRLPDPVPVQKAAPPPPALDPPLLPLLAFLELVALAPPTVMLTLMPSA